MWGRCAVAGAPSPVLQLCRSVWSYAACLLLCMILFCLLCSVWSASGLLCVIRFSCLAPVLLLRSVKKRVYHYSMPLCSWSYAACVLLFGAGLCLQCFSCCRCYAAHLLLCDLLQLSCSVPEAMQHVCSVCQCCRSMWCAACLLRCSMLYWFYYQYPLKLCSVCAPDLLPVICFSCSASGLQCCRSEW